MVQHSPPTARYLTRSVLCFVFLVGCLAIATSCDKLENIAGASVKTVVEDIDRTRYDINSDQAQWQENLNVLEQKLNRHMGGIAKDALDHIQSIQREAINGLSEQARCSAKTVGQSVSYELLCLRDRLLRSSTKESPPAPVVCLIRPTVLDLNNSAEHQLQISGAFFYAQGKPRVLVRYKDNSQKEVNEDLISRQTDWSMTVSLDPIKQLGLLGPSARQLIISNGVGDDENHEVEVLPVPQCDDKLRNQDETDTDCGGNRCGRCARTLMCLNDGDCSDGVCISGKCGLHTMGDSGALVDFGGGGGGTPKPLVQCPSGSVAIGFEVRTGNVFDAINLVCSTLQSDGTMSGESRSPRVGGGGGKEDHVSRCPNGRVLRGIKGRTGGYIDQMASECSSAAQIAQRIAAPVTETGPIISPSSQGTEAEAQCPSGQAITGIDARVGFFIDHLRFQCSWIERKP